MEHGDNLIMCRQAANKQPVTTLGEENETNFTLLLILSYTFFAALRLAALFAEKLLFVFGVFLSNVQFFCLQLSI
jgi:hypothetical protein